MQFDVITLFPQFFESPLKQSLLNRAIECGLVEIKLHHLRDHGVGRHKVCDDVPYGGGGGMVLKPEPLSQAVESILHAESPQPSMTILLSPQGAVLNQQKVKKLSELQRVILVCGRYEGVDERFRELYVDEEISVGDYILSGGEAAALILIEAVARLVPGVVGNPESLCDESFEDDTLQYPHYTRPLVFSGQKVPDILRSGDHKQIKLWRKKQAYDRTRTRRPDLLKKRGKNNESYS
ncbi:MAG: tRNA (guanosine(37)-N1)-methyltransferase TrmD [Deltaproteobacteria bacterium]|nr:tRNA (guanosine(37)-N1)-methyltransferase TrmD [Deltaproteobacteria bacterium]